MFFFVLCFFVLLIIFFFFFFFQAEDGIRDLYVTGVQTCALPILAFAGHCGLEIRLDGWADNPLRGLFNEELGAVVQVRTADRDAFMALAAKHGLAAMAHVIGRPKPKLGIKLLVGDEKLAKWNWTQLFTAWHETSHAMQRLRDNPASADAERVWRIADDDPGISPRLTFEPGDDVAAPYIARGARPRVAVLREQGVNGQVEMAAAFT